MLLGLDPSLRGYGIAFLDSDLSSSFKLLSPKGTELFAKYEIYKELLLLPKAELAVMEAPSYNSTHRAFTLGAIKGITEIILLEKGVPFFEIPPKSMKLFITGNGNATKELVAKCLKKKLQFLVKDNNLTDALALAYIGYCKINNIWETRYQLEILTRECVA